MLILLLFCPKILYKTKKIYKFAAHYNGLIVSFCAVFFFNKGFVRFYTWQTLAKLCPFTNTITKLNEENCSCYLLLSTQLW